MGHHRSSPRPSSMGRRAIRSLTDEDVHTGWRRIYSTYKRAGAAAKDKRLTRRRERREGERELLREVREVVA